MVFEKCVAYANILRLCITVLASTSIVKSFTLYLSTIGNRMGPSLDLLKFGRLSRCGMNGNPLYRVEVVQESK